MKTEPVNLTHQFLVAMPDLDDPRFHRAVIYVFRHTPEGSAGLVINQPSDLRVDHLLRDMRLPPLKPLPRPDQPVLQGGPVHTELGFVLHEDHGPWTSTLHSSEQIAITHSRDILDAISQGHGPKNYLISLGYAGWEPGQLESELAENVWLTVPASAELLFEVPYEARWEASMRSLGLDWPLLSHDVGHA